MASNGEKKTGCLHRGFDPTKDNYCLACGTLMVDLEDLPEALQEMYQQTHQFDFMGRPTRRPVVETRQTP